MTKLLLVLALGILAARVLGASLRASGRRPDSTEARGQESLEMQRCQVCGEFSLPSATPLGAFRCPSCRARAAGAR